MCISRRNGLFFCQYQFFVSNLQTASWASDLFSLHKPGHGEKVWRQREDRRPPGYFLLLLVNDYKSPLTGTLKVYFIIALVQRTIIGFYGGEGLSFSLTRQRHAFGVIPWKSKGSIGSVWYFFLFLKVLLKLFSPVMTDNRGKGTQREFHVLFNHGTFLWLTFWTHIGCIPVDWEKRIKDFVKWCIISFMSDMQFKIYSIFHEHMSWTHGFCKPLLCGCTYCYFVYWNKERSIYKIIKWSLHASYVIFTFSVICNYTLYCTVYQYILCCSPTRFLAKANWWIPSLLKFRIHHKSRYFK